MEPVDRLACGPRIFIVIDNENNQYYGKPGVAWKRYYFGTYVVDLLDVEYETDLEMITDDLARFPNEEQARAYGERILKARVLK